MALLILLIKKLKSILKAGLINFDQVGYYKLQHRIGKYYEH